MTDWTDVSPDTTIYRKLLAGYLYAGSNGTLYAGSLTVPIDPTEPDFYAGYIGTSVGAATWTDISATTTWTDV